MNKNPLISCIITTYNKFDKIYKTLDSVFEQSYNNIELIIADDGSPNIPVEDIESYINSIKKENKALNISSYSVLLSDENMGTVKNLNRALKASKGEYIIELAGDDFFYSVDSIKNIVERMQKMNWDFIVCRRMLCNSELKEICLIPSDEEIKFIGKSNTAEKQKRDLAIGRFHNMASGSVFSFKKSFIESMGFYDEKYRLWEDGPIFYKILSKGIPLNTAYDLITVLYQDGGVSTSNIINPYMQKDKLLFTENVLAEIDNFDKPAKRWIKFQYEKERIDRKNKMIVFKFVLKYFDILFIRKILHK